MKFLFVLALALISSPICAQQQASNVRAELAAIDFTHFKNLDDYLAKSAKVRVLLPSLDAFYVQGAKTIARTKRQHPDDKDLNTLADFFSALNAKDQEAFYLLSHEMNLASQMSKLPRSDWPAFFNQRIAPLEQEERRISEEEVRMAVDGRNRGLPLPDDMLQSLRDRK